MKNKMNTRLFLISSVLSLSLCLGSCVEYLDKAPESTLTEKEVFGNFNSFQGWVEQMYICMANYHQRCAGNWYHTFNITDMLTSIPMYWDDGNYWDQKFTWGGGGLDLSGESGVMNKFVWPLAWYAIRKANLGLQNLELMQGTQEEKNLIKGQCLYFRAFYHLELMQFFGGLPYIDEVLSSSDVLIYPRLSYRDCALKAAEDFKAAAELLPLSWAQTNTIVKDNDGCRITKIHALGYLGKNLLYAASPLMNESSTGKNAYDADLCKQAAEAFAEVIKLCEQPGSKYRLETWANWPSIFAVVSTSKTVRSGGAEVIQNQMYYDDNFVRWTTTRAASPTVWVAGNDKTEVPAHNYVKYYHMANGLPIDDPDSGFDPNNPWTNREPRFYNDIIFHGTRMIINASTAAAKLDEFAQLDNKGRHRHATAAAGSFAGSVTGYYYKKFLPLGCNPTDNQWGNLHAYQPRLRMADIYLMYAEAVFYGYGSATASYPGAGYTAQSAIERIRGRAQLPALPDRYYNNATFMETLIRERAVELAFEGHRWFDLRRWNIATELKYREKTSIAFDLDEAGKPSNFREVLYTTRVHDRKHNWLPFQTRFTTIHEGFPQNPGW